MLDRQKVYLITSNAESGTLESLPITAHLEIISNDDLVKTDLRFGKDDKVCIASEVSMETIVSRMDDLSRKNTIESLKDKYIFRKTIASIYPEYQYQFVKANQINTLTITHKSVIKPVKGVFGTAVRTIDRDTDLTNLAKELTVELSKNEGIFSDGVLSKEDFLVEEYIEGEEYAVDMFYDADGNPCIINICHHPIPENKAYLHILYYFSKEVFDLIYTKAKHFFTQLNQILNVTNITMHCEFKLDGDRLMPIEINTLRYGGMGFGNMVFHALGINPYTYFLNNIEPDWQTIWKDRGEDIFCFFIAYNGANINLNEYRPNRERLEQQFTDILLERSFDYQTQLTFGIYCLKETKENLANLLKIDFDDFFDPI
jgi:ATP-grasp domain